MAAQLVHLTRLPQPAVFRQSAGLGGIDECFPKERGREPRKAKIEIAVIGIHHDEKALVDIALSAARIELAGGAAQHVTKRQGRLIAPVFAGNLDPVRGYPGDVLEPGLRHDLDRKSTRLNSSHLVIS